MLIKWFWRRSIKKVVVKGLKQVVHGIFTGMWRSGALPSLMGFCLDSKAIILLGVLLAPFLPLANQVAATRKHPAHTVIFHPHCHLSSPSLDNVKPPLFQLG